MTSLSLKRIVIKTREHSGSVVECLTGFEPHCVVVLEQDTFILA